jgi:hypothetical protein
VKVTLVRIERTKAAFTRNGKARTSSGGAAILQLACGVFVAHEAVPGTEWVGFAIVWLALAVLTFDSLRQARSTHAVDQPGDTIPAICSAAESGQIIISSDQPVESRQS